MPANEIYSWKEVAPFVSDLIKPALERASRIKLLQGEIPGFEVRAQEFEDAMGPVRDEFDAKTKRIAQLAQEQISLTLACDALERKLNELRHSKNEELDHVQRAKEEIARLETGA